MNVATHAIVEARDVSFTIRGTRLVGDVSLSLNAATLTIVIGPNGAGKSTLLRLMAGESPRSAGSVRYGETDVQLFPPWHLAMRRAVMAQAIRLAFPFTVYEVVRLGIDGLGRRVRRAEREHIIADALSRAEVSHLAARVYQSLSGGEQQRVQFARALCQLSGGKLVSADQALFLDEPTAHLDMSHQLMVMDHVRRLAESGTAVFVTMHDLNLAAAYADHLVILKRGHLVAQGRPEDVLTRARVRNVFAIDDMVGEMPAAGAAFLLPHRHAEAQKKPRHFSGNR